MRNIPELLAPAGGLAQLQAAVNNGADAVYLGGARFNARAKAENFTLPKLRDAIGYAHERNVKIYVTFNTLLKDRELPYALDYAGALWDVGADAVIVQDMGLIRLIGKYLPEMPMHLSTQGTVTGKWAVDLMKDFGIRRIVPARELSLEEIREMAEVCHNAADRPYCELEVFVHGALCMCYSGQCQMSRLLGGGSARSGNRGLCAQPCRLPYTDDRGRTGYFLSPKDLCLLEDIPALCEAGVDSLKIEGRLKSPEYVAVVTGIYRKYLDQYAQTGRIRISEDDRRDLTQIYNRGGFTKGYLYGNPGEEILSGSSPKNAGIYIGEVRAVVDPKQAGPDRSAAAGAAKKGAVLVDAVLQGGLEKDDWAETLAEGDGVEFRPYSAADAAGKTNPKGATGSAGKYDPTAAADPAGGVVTYRRELPGGVLRIGDMKGRVRPGDGVYRVTQRKLLERARATFDVDDPAALDQRMVRRIPLQMTFTAAADAPAVLEIREMTAMPDNQEIREMTAMPDDPEIRENSHEICVTSQEPMEPARNRAAEPERIRQQLGKLGGTPFEAAPEDIEVILDGRCAVPVAKINQLRREGIGQLLEEKRRSDRKPVDMQALAQAQMQLTEAYLKEPVLPELTEVQLVPLMEYMDRVTAEAGRGQMMPYIDAVSKGWLDTYVEAHFEEIAARLKASGTGILIRGNSWIRQFLDAGVQVFGGHGLNVYNEEARRAYEDMGVTVAELSHETGLAGLANTAELAGLASDGRIPLMITEHPVQSKTLTDRKGQVHLVERSPAGDKTIIW